MKKLILCILPICGSMNALRPAQAPTSHKTNTFQLIQHPVVHKRIAVNEEIILSGYDLCYDFTTQQWIPANIEKQITGVTLKQYDKTFLELQDTGFGNFYLHEHGGLPIEDLHVFRALKSGTARIVFHAKTTTDVIHEFTCEITIVPKTSR